MNMQILVESLKARIKNRLPLSEEAHFLIGLRLIVESLKFIVERQGLELQQIHT